MSGFDYIAAEETIVQAPGEKLDYSFDLSTFPLGEGETVASIGDLTIVPEPADPADFSVSNIVADGNLILFHLEGELDDADYVVTIFITTDFISGQHNTRACVFNVKIRSH